MSVNQEDLLQEPELGESEVGGSNRGPALSTGDALKAMSKLGFHLFYYVALTSNTKLK